MTVKEIVAAWLKENGYDGLYSDDCGCNITHFMPCCGDFSECQAGVFVNLSDRKDGFDFWIGPKKEAGK